MDCCLMSRPTASSPSKTLPAQKGSRHRVSLFQDLANMGLKNFINDVLHLPVVEYVSDVLFWSVFLLLGPVFAVGYLVVVLVDICTGYIWWRYEEPDDQRPIVVTGCDTGFGRQLAMGLHERGWKVYACCMSDQGFKELHKVDGGKKLVPVMLNVTKGSDIDSLARKVEEEHPQGLYALVNNAGILSAGFVDWMPMDDMRLMMEVNFMGAASMIKTFLPHLKKWGAGARIVNTSSMAGIAPGTICLAGYMASKHALEVYSNSLHGELAPWGIRVATVNPSFHRTPMGTSWVDSIMSAFNKLTPEVREQYGETYAKAAQHSCDVVFNHEWDPKHVVRALLHATIGTRPRVQYRIGMDARYYLAFGNKWPARVMQFYYHTFHYPKILPAAVEKRRTAATETRAKAE